MGEEPTEHLLLREKIVKVCSQFSTPGLGQRLTLRKAAAPLAMAALGAAPAELGLALKRQAEITNLPRVGYDGNYAFPTMQGNFAAAQCADALACAWASSSVQSVLPC